MGWPILRMALYVKQSKYLQKLKEDKDVWSGAFRTASFLMFSKDRPLITSGHPTSPDETWATKINWRTYEEVAPYCQDLMGSSAVLGVDENKADKALFVCPVNPSSAEDIQTKFEGRFVDMRMAIMSLPPTEAHLVGRGYTLLKWNEDCRFCQYCGNPMNKTYSGCVRECSNSSCTYSQQYPSVSPIAITRVLDHTKEKALLVRQSRHPKGMYSCIAGFIEPGETLQDGVRREIAEEAGIVVEDIKYFQSQPWPMPVPSQLMLAATAVAMKDSDELDIDKGELEDARWFSKAEVKEAYEKVKNNPLIFRSRESDVGLLIPPSGAIAHHLLKNWVEDYIPSQL